MGTIKTVWTNQNIYQFLTSLSSLQNVWTNQNIYHFWTSFSSLQTQSSHLKNEWGHWYNLGNEGSMLSKKGTEKIETPWLQNCVTFHKPKHLPEKNWAHWRVGAAYVAEVRYYGKANNLDSKTCNFVWTLLLVHVYSGRSHSKLQNGIVSP